MIDNKSFEGLINIAKSGNKKTLYDITNIKRISQNRSTSANAFSTSLANSFTNNVSQSNSNVKSNTSTKYSISKNENNTLKLEDRVSGDDLLNAQDMIADLSNVNAKIDDKF